MQAMGQGMNPDDGGRDAIILEWVRTGAVAPDLHENLRERFLRSWTKKPVQG